MFKKKYPSPKPLDTYPLDQLEIAAADTAFLLLSENKKISDLTNIQVCVLKNFFIMFKSNIAYASQDAQDIGIFRDQVSVEGIKKIFRTSLCVNSEEKMLINVIDEDITKVIISIKIQSLIQDLNNKKYYDLTSKKIFSLMNRLLPYYHPSIRSYFTLENLFDSFKKMRFNFFKNLNAILLKEPKSNLAAQMQISYLCSMLMWVTNVKNISFFLIIDTILVLSKYNLVNFMFKQYYLSDNEISFLLPMPFRAVKFLSKHFAHEKNNKTRILIALNNAEKDFVEDWKKNSLQMSLRREFIFFIDILLDFALATTQENRTLILDHYNGFRPLIREIFLIFTQNVMNLNERIQSLSLSEIEKAQLEHEKIPSKVMCDKILAMMDKWQACIQTNLQIFKQSEKIALALTEQERTEIDNNQAFLAQAIQQPSKQAIQAAQQFAEKLKKAAEKEALEQKKTVAANSLKFDLIDQYQQELAKKFLTISNLQNLEQEELLNNKEKIIVQEIVKYMKLKPIKKLLDIALLTELEDFLFSLPNEIQADELHILLLAYINLLDIFLSRINYRMKTYKQEYVPLIVKMLDRHGQKNFSGEDHVLSRKIKQNAKQILANLAATNDYCECILTIFDSINILKPKIIDIEFYKIWTLPINFRKREFKDSCNNASDNLSQFCNYLEIKKNACIKTGITSKNKKNRVGINEKEIHLKLENLKDALYKIDSQISKNDCLRQPFPNTLLNKHSQVRELQIQNAIISRDKLRVPMPYNPNEVRRSQSIANFNSVNVAKNQELRFFSSRSQTDTKEDNKLKGTTMSYRRMSI